MSTAGEHDMRNLYLVLLAWTIVLLVATPAGAVNIETLVMPGELIEGHAKYEQECDQCHQRFRKASQSKLCLDCHEKVAADVDARKGYHGRHERIRKVECKICHTDHKGRKADVVPLDVQRFDHGITDFPLKGAHLKAGCDGCHEPTSLYREAPSQCVDCHKEQDAHKKRLGEACHECHQPGSWTRTEFDHAITDFPLWHKHAELTCSSCHPNQRYEGTPTDCYSCHALNDFHRGDYGTRCDRCHTPREWESSIFEHARDTDFVLKHGHLKVACGGCHDGKLYGQKRDKTCFACHRNEDVHSGHNGRKCNECHSPRGWTRVSFDHKKDTDFALLGKHADLNCRACHKGEAEDDKPSSDCYACHRGDDVHQGQEGKRCDSCHDAQGWGRGVFFEHDMTRFPLIGLHGVVPCEECHLAATFKDAPLDCGSCHEADDVHERRLAKECADCHNPNGWKLWQFDHNTETDFKLDGEHEKLHCDACHTVPIEKLGAQSRQCSTCHWKDDRHDGRFGLNCARCHTTEVFKPAGLIQRLTEAGP